MTLFKRVSLLRTKILLAKRYDKNGNERTTFQIIMMLLTRYAFQEAFFRRDYRYIGMSTTARIALTRKYILTVERFDRKFKLRSPIRIMNRMLTRCALQDISIQDKELETEFSTWQNEEIIKENMELES
ncbi:hypothetical protein LSS_15086 [Leptospira santarosai serovar Shermani str. LT 821]|uniref:Uncharacterized protein n=1 Tax=Leptospira santarosai serovar Shermani str. LT 821 TaxID=758847 RepID=K8XYM1_9LEPT|nr:hypothetical protein LSS_15086 [Leptospira santarosai serovar Shermani str. LT 821]